MKFLILSFFSFFLNTAFTQNKFIVYDVCEKCDFDYQSIQEIDTFSRHNMIERVFKPIEGNYKVYRFIEYYWGTSMEFYPDSLVAEEHHNILMIKVDSKSKILDAFTYSLEFSDSPASCDLYKLKKSKSYTLMLGLNLSNLKFELQSDHNYCGRDPILYLSQCLDDLNPYPRKW